MPKVNEEYFQIKKDRILDAAFTVCAKKPVYSVTMKDIVKESGLSQGGVYKYYSNIDDVLISLIGRNKYDFKSTINSIINSNDRPEDIIFNIIKLLKDVYFKTIRSYGKILFEMQAIFFSEPKRLDNSRTKMDSRLNFNYWFGGLFNYIENMVKKSYFKPVIPLNDIYMFMIASVDGIVRHLILTEHYKLNRKLYHYKNNTVKDIDFDPDVLMNTLYKSILFFLGAN